MLSPAEIKQIVVMRAAGHSIASIAETVGVSATAIKSAVKTHKVAKGSAMTELISAAQDKLKSDHTLTESLKQSIAGMLCDDLALIRKLREGVLITLEELEADKELSAVAKSRALAGLSTVLVVTNSVWRKSLQASRIESLAPAAEAEPLTIHFMSSEDEAGIRAMTNSDDFGVKAHDEYLGGEDEPDNDVVEETYD